MNIFGKITNYFLKNKSITAVLLIAVILLGAISYISTPKQYNPEVKMPAFQVIVEYPGTKATEVEKYVTKELTEKITDIKGIDNISSYSYGGGMSVVNVSFKVGEDIEDSEVKLRSKIFGNIDSLKGVDFNVIIKSINPEDVPVLTVGFYSKELNQNQLREKVINIKEQLRTVKDTANLEVHGGEKKSIKVDLELSKLKYYGVSPFEIEDKIKNNNLYAEHFIKRDGQNISQVELNGTINSVNDLKELKNRDYLKLKDIANIYEGYSQKNSYVFLSNKNSLENDYIFLSLAKVEGSNTSTVTTDSINKLNDILEQKEYENIKFEILNNDGKVAEKEITGLASNLAQSILIVLVVLLAFLDRRSAIIVAVSIPLTLLLVFSLGYFTGNTINRITMFSLILSLGLLVDSATVVVENIYRHLSEKDDKESILNTIVKSVNEVGIGLFMSTLTSVVVFLPTSQISGMMGEYMGPLSFFVPVALIMSLFVALVFIPYISFYFLKIKTKKTNKLNPIDKLNQFYQKLLVALLNSKSKQNKFIIGLIVALIIVFLFPIFELVHFKMLPTANRNQFFLYLDLKEGSDIIRTKEDVLKINSILLENQNILSIESFVGEPAVTDFNGLFKGSNYRNSPNQATLKINLKDTDSRTQKSEEIVSWAREELQRKFSSNNSVSYRILEDPPGPPVMSTFQAKVKTDNNEIRTDFTNKLSKLVSGIDGVVHIDNSIEGGIYREKININHEKASFYNIDLAQVYSILKGTYSITNVSQIKNNNNNEVSFIELSVPIDDSSRTNILKDIFVSNKYGQIVPLNKFAEIENTRHESTIISDNKERSEYINAETNQRSIVYVVIELIKKILSSSLDGYYVESWSLYEINLKHESGNSVKLEWGGEWEMTLDNFRDLGIAMLIAFFLIFAVLTAQFSNYKTSLIIMSTIPLGFIGILPGFAILDINYGTFLTATSLIGFIALMGIVVNNAIIYFEYFEQLKEIGLTTKEALIRAGTTRFRPILLTSLTTILGSLTIANDPVWSGLAWAIVFGLFVSTVLTLFLFPVIIIYKEK